MDETALRRLMRETEWSDINIEVLMRDRLQCRYCDADGLADFETFLFMAVDHVVPGGPNDASNGALACRRCNSRKRDRLPPGTTPETLLALPLDDRINRVRGWLNDGSVTRSQKPVWEAFRAVYGSGSESEE